MGKYKITYCEPDVVNITTTIEAETVIDALFIFIETHPKALDYEVEEVVQNESLSISKESS